MERSKQPAQTNDGKIWWKKIGGGSLRIHRKIIKPNQRFRARPDEISERFRDVIIPLEELAAEEPTAPINAVQTEFILRPRGKSKSLFDVVYPVGEDEDGEPTYKVMNEKALTKILAEKLIRELSRK